MKNTIIKNQLIVILGGGESGIGAALLANKYRIKIFLSDSGKILNKYKKILKKNKIPFEEKKHSENLIFQKKKLITIIKSPGISKKNKFIKKMNFLKIPILSELEFGKSFSKDSYIIGVTGSNGKTTTSTIIYKILKKEKGIQVGLAGNIGKSFSKEICLKKRKIYVLEISSFQLDDCSNFRPNISILLNITNDHLDRYDNIEKYIHSKFRISFFQKKKDIFIYNYDDDRIRKGIENYSILSQCIPFSIKKKLRFGAYIEKNKIFYRNNQNQEILDIKNIPIIGDHHLYNILPSFIVSKILKISNKSIYSILSKFKPIKHRMEKVLSINGVHFINDSKATNVNAVFYALKSLKNIIWIAGGKDKGNDYQELIPLVKERVKALICLGKNNKKIFSFFQNFIPIILETKDLKKAVFLSYKFSSPGDNILFSPSCSSFDLFKNYQERGNQFKKQVKHLFFQNQKKK